MEPIPELLQRASSLAFDSLSAGTAAERSADALYLLGVFLIIQGARHSRTWLLAMPFLLAVGGTVPERALLALRSAAMAAVGIALGAFGCRVAGKIYATEAVL